MAFEFEKQSDGYGKHCRGEQLSHGYESPKVSDVRIRHAEEFRENPERGVFSEERGGDHSRGVPGF